MTLPASVFAMPEPEDIVDIDGLRASERGEPVARRRFLSIWYRCCHVYGRLYRNAAGTAYEGRCPSCGAPTRARIAPHGSPGRTFEAR